MSRQLQGETFEPSQFDWTLSSAVSAPEKSNVFLILIEKKWKREQKNKETLMCENAS